MIDSGSFRDPCGFIVREGNNIYRVIHQMYEKEYTHFTSSGLSDILIKNGLLIPHKEIEAKMNYIPEQFKILQVERIPFISYPYEWCFSQLQDAALLTLDIDLLAIDYGMILKDATPYNVQFHNGKPIFIDTLSFNLVEKNFEWKAYKQFCEFFIIPLALMAYKDPRLNVLLKDFINGIPLNLGVKLIPKRYYFIPSLFLHIYLHSKIQNSDAKKNKSLQNKIITKEQHKALILYLRSFIKHLKLPKHKTESSTYYSETKNTNQSYIKSKEQLVEEIVKSIKPKIIWDIGANDGKFSRICSKYSKQVISIDNDWNCAEFNYNECRRSNISNIVPIISDLVNPSSGLGWNNEERRSLFTRSQKPDLIIALAVLHHLINENIPLSKIIDFLCYSNDYVILEFIPDTDIKVLSMKEIKNENWKYIEENEFQNIIQTKFKILSKYQLEMTSRILYVLKRKTNDE